MNAGRSASRKLPRPGRLLWAERLIDWLFGYDFFLSYGHADGTEYPRALARTLSSRGFKVFLDEEVYRAGDDLRRATRRRIRMSRELVVLARPHALSSGWVQREVEASIEAERRVLVIDVGGALQAAPQSTVSELLQDRLHIREPSDTVPSELTISELQRSFQGTRQETRRLRFFALASVLLIGLVVLSVALWRQADLAREEAQRNLELATQRQKETERERSRADERARTADAQRLAVVAGTQQETNPTLGLLLAVEARARLGRREAAVEQALWDAWRSVTGHGLAIHENWVQGMAASGDGRWLVTSDRDGKLFRWDTHARSPGRDAVHVGTHPGVVQFLAVFEHGSRVVSASSNRQIVVWSLDPPAPEQAAVAFPALPDAISAMAVHRASRRLAVACDVGVILLWSFDELLAGEAATLLKGHAPGEPMIWGLAFSPDGNWLLSGGQDGSARLWPLSKPGVSVHLSDLGAHVRAVAFSPDSRVAYVGSRDGMLEAWSVSSTPERLFQRNFDRQDIYCLAAERRRLAVGVKDGTHAVQTYFLDRQGVPKEAGTQAHNGEGAARALSFVPDSQVFLSGTSEGYVRLTSVMHGAKSRRLRGLAIGSGKWVLRCIASPDGSWVAAGGMDGTARLWALDEEHRIRDPWVLHTEHPGVLAHAAREGSLGGFVRVTRLGIAFDRVSEDGLVAEAQFTPDVDGFWGYATACVAGERVYAASNDGALHVWDLGGEVPEPRVFKAEFAFTPKMIAVSGVGTHVAVVARRRGAEAPDTPVILVWDVTRSSESPVVLEGHTGPITEIAFHPSEPLLVSGAMDGMAREWAFAVPSSAPRTLPHPNLLVERARYTPDGRTCVTASNGALHLWAQDESETSSHPRRLPGHAGEIRCMVFRRDGQELVTGSVNGSVRLWNLTGPDAGSEALVLARHGRVVSTLALSADERWLLSGGGAGENDVRIWDLHAADPRIGSLRLHGHENSLQSITLSNCGDYLVSIDDGGHMHAWPLRHETREKELRRRAGRALSEEERLQYLGASEDASTEDDS